MSSQIKTIVLGLLITISISAETVTLIQGVNGYSGCSDSYMESTDQYGISLTTKNHGNEERLASGYIRHMSF